MSENKDQEYFADGMAEEVLDQLVKVPQLKVISRTSSFQYKGKTTDIRAIGAALGARYLVEGSVRKAGNKLRITVELIDAQDGAQRWADRYDRDIGDVLKVQDEIAISLVRALQVSVGAFELPTRTAVRVPAAYDAYLRARHAADQFNEKGFKEAIDDYREALRLDPQYSRAAAALAMLQTNLGEWGYLPVDTAFSEARASAELAIQLDGTLAMPHAILALTHVLYDWDWPAAQRELATANALPPRDPITEWTAGQLSVAEGNWDEAISHLNASLALDPLSAGTYYVLCGALVRAGRLAQAEDAIRKALQISPSYAWAHYQFGNVLVLQGKPSEAQAVFQDEPDPEAHLYGLALTHYALGHRQASDAALEELTKLAAGDWAFGIATVHAYRGEVDQAFAWIERAYAQKDVDLAIFKGDPISSKIWPDPRYKAFLRKMNLPE
jgi:TolB-like protein/Flp pilus assembly protein TadD